MHLKLSNYDIILLWLIALDHHHCLLYLVGESLNRKKSLEYFPPFRLADGAVIGRGKTAGPCPSLFI
jgi:hypothetical protein